MSSSAGINLGHLLKLSKTSSNTTLSPLLHSKGYHVLETQYKFASRPSLPRLHEKTGKWIDVTLAGAPNRSDHMICSVEDKSTALDLTARVTVKFKKPASFIETILRSAGPPNGGVVLQLVSKEVDPETMKPKLSKEAILNWSRSFTAEDENRAFEVKIEVDDRNFGVPGAVYVYNQYPEEFFLESICIDSVVRFSCGSWVQPSEVDPGKRRVFFYDKAHLPSETPSGLAELRECELKDLRGNGKGLRLASDRIYDYDVYNDLGNSEKGPDYVRPTLGGSEKSPYPRRCRTGRLPTPNDVSIESPSSPSMPSYVPRDEDYNERKKEFMSQGKTKAVIRNIIPILIAKMFGEKNLYFSVDDTAKHHPILKIVSLDERVNRNPLFKMLTKLHGTIERMAKVEPPKYISKDVVWGLPDDEFGRRALAGVNPMSIEKLKVFPPVSKLDPSIYGPQESGLKEEHILGYLEGMTVQQALDEGKMFILDFHDIYLPVVDRINAIEGRKTYATRTVFFLTSFQTLKPIAIELSLSVTGEKASSKRVLTPPIDIGTSDYWLWQLAKEHVCSNDSAVHTLINHWLRIHACMEPFFIAAHRNMSVMHPVFKLLHPHMRYLMKTNAFSRDVLINAGAIIESFNSPAKYCMQFSGYAYKDWWRFDLEGLPDDLIRRGMAVQDPESPHGIKLAIDDYPYAQDSLLIWSAIESLVTKYVGHYYPEPSHIQTDTELQAWYRESVDSGHADLRAATWWPRLATRDDLVKILTTVIWTVTGQHAVVNFGQYSYGAYTPARPPFMRKLLPSDSDPDFLSDPREYFLSAVPGLTQEAKYAAVLDTGSGHSPEEEYIGQRKDLASWCGEPGILEAFEKFTSDVERIEREIERRNSDPGLKNRCGPGVYPFELLMPSSGSGTTSRGVPNSVTA